MNQDNMVRVTRHLLVPFKHRGARVVFTLVLLLLIHFLFKFYYPCANRPNQNNRRPNWLEPSVHNNLPGNVSQFYHLLGYEYANMEFNSSTNDNVTGFGSLIVPDIVHYVQLDNPHMEFITLISIMSVLRHHRPRLILIHTDCVQLRGKYWEKVLQLNQSENNTMIYVNHIKRPKYIFNRKLSSVYHAGDIARIRLLRQFGGIYLDNDVYVVQPLHRYRKFEFAIGWPEGTFLGTQVLVCHRNARFLRLWYKSYHNYKANLWYYNAGELPTKSILVRNPSLVHRVPMRFGVHMLVRMLYDRYNPRWKEQYDTIHLLTRHRSYLVARTDGIVNFNEYNIGQYNQTFGEMARLVYFGDQHLRE